MSYRLQTKRNQRTPKSLLFLSLLILLVALFLFTPLSNSMRFLVHSLGTDSAVSGILGWFSFKSSLLEENKNLSEEVASLKALSLERDALLSENLALKEISKSEESLIASVLLHPGFSPYDSLLVSKGSASGVALGDLVLFHAIAIGEVSEVNKNTSRVTLFSTGGKTFPVHIGENKIEAEARGLGGGTFEIMMPANAEVMIGDTVLMPASLTRIFGRIEDIEKTDGEPFQRLLFSLPVNINDVQFVVIEKPEI
ncbi:MAG TPA: rod shape-determining protein MreC [Candidatus Paceibacterota bacterium]|nr:rod shape-determining protein MreC [Candidatus Paceibacterota bacterium]